MPTDAEIPASALAVYAHPDDPEISAGGTLASWAEAGADVAVLITTQGDKGTQDPDADLGELARLRVEETAKAAALLGFTGHFHLGYHDGELPDDQELRAALCEAYFGKLGGPQLARMNLFALMSDVGWTLWGAIQARISTLDFDFTDYYTTRWSRALAVMDSYRFQAWLEEARHNDP